MEEQLNQFSTSYRQLRDEIAKVIVGQDEIVEGVVICMIAGGHALLEGVPGLGKTKLVRTLSQALSLQFSRVQFTPDLMPADITGTNMIVEDAHGHKQFDFVKGPIFANVILADEINRATPKTQSALLEAMQEKSVTVGKQTYALELPFFVLATQNPLEMEGTYPLPEAQLDRFLFKLQVKFPSRDQLHQIMDLTTQRSDAKVNPVLDRERILWMRSVALDVPVARHVQDYAIRVLEATHPDRDGSPEISKRYIRFGASPRGAQSVIVAAKIKAVFEGRFNVAMDDVRYVTKSALRHRLILNFEGEAEGVTSDQVLDGILKVVPEGRP